MKRNGLTAAALAWAGLILFLSSISQSKYDTLLGWTDFMSGSEYFVHGVLYFVLAALVFGVLRANWPKRGWLVVPDTLVFCLVYGHGDELHKTFVPGRSAVGFSVIADVLGAAVAVILLLIVIGLRRKPTESEDEPR